jgi:hypothetical protein
MMKAGEVGSHAVYPRASKVFRIPPQTAIELLHGLPVECGLEKAVVLFGRSTCKRLEPVCIMRRTLVERPGLHSGGDLIGHASVDLLAQFHGRHNAFVGLIAQIISHGLSVEDHFAEIRGNASVWNIQLHWRSLGRCFKTLKTMIRHDVKILANLCKQKFFSDNYPLFFRGLIEGL